MWRAVWTQTTCEHRGLPGGLGGGGGGVRRVVWTRSDYISAPGGCSEEKVSGELFGLKVTAPEHREAAWRRSVVGRLVFSGRTRAPGSCPEDPCSGSRGFRATQSDRS